jgi:hypothetical protein
MAHHEALRQRLHYLIEHGGLWEQAQDRTARTHRLILVGIALVVTLQLAELAVLLH